MGRRYSGNMKGEQLLGNASNKEVHDLDQEDTNPNGCQIGEIIAAGHDRPCKSLLAAQVSGYDNFAKCLGASTR